MAKLDDLIQQKQQRDEDWKSRKAAEREELGRFPTMRSCTSPVNPAHICIIWTRRPSTRDTAHPM